MVLKPISEDSPDLSPAVTRALGRRRADFGTVTELVRTIARSPVGLAAFLPMSRHIRLGSSLSDYQRELIILRIACRRDIAYVKKHHLPLGVKAGLSGPQIEALGDDRLPEHLFPQPADLTTIQLVDGLLESVGGQVGQDILRDAGRCYSDEQLVDIGLTIGWYGLIGTILSLTDLQ